MTSDASTTCPTCEDEFTTRSQYITHRQVKHPEEVHVCGFPDNSFACRIRHQEINTGAAKANESPTDGSRWERAADVHHNRFG